MEVVKPVVGLAVVKPSMPSFLRCLFYGDAGVGKTWLVATADDCEAMRPVLLCDADRGLLTVANRTFDVFELTSLDDGFKVLRQVRAHPEEYRTIIFDGLLSLYMLVMGARLKLAQEKPGRDPFVPERGDWLHTTFRMRALLEEFKKLPVNFLATTCVVTDKDEATGVTTTLPGMPGKMASEVGQLFDVVGYLYVKAFGKKLTRMLQLQPFNRVSAKNRSPYAAGMGPLVENPTMPALYNAAILGEVAGLAVATPEPGGKEEGKEGTKD